MLYTILGENTEAHSNKLHKPQIRRVSSILNYSTYRNCRFWITYNVIQAGLIFSNVSFAVINAWWITLNDGLFDWNSHTWYCKIYNRKKYLEEEIVASLLVYIQWAITYQLFRPLFLRLVSGQLQLCAYVLAVLPVLHEKFHHRRHR